VPSWRAMVMMVLKRPLYWAAAGLCTNTALPAFTATRARPSPCICNHLHTLVTNKLSKNQIISRGFNSIHMVEHLTLMLCVYACVHERVLCINIVHVGDLTLLWQCRIKLRSCGLAPYSLVVHLQTELIQSTYQTARCYVQEVFSALRTSNFILFKHQYGNFDFLIFYPSVLPKEEQDRHCTIILH
jgi:hypothetical protein